MLIEKMHIKTNALLNKCLSPKSVYNQEGPIDNFAVIEHIRNLYECMNDVPCGPPFTVVVPEINENDYQNKFLQEVLNIKKLIKMDPLYIKDILVHGSIATLDYVEGWSDLDLIIVLDADALKNEHSFTSVSRKIRDIDNCIRRFDPLQHHGAHILIPDDFEMYPSVFLPPELYSEAKSLMGESEYVFWKVPSHQQEQNRLAAICDTFIRAEHDGLMRHHSHWGEYLKDNFQNADNGMYQMKYFLSVIMLLPSLFMNRQGVYCTKKDSFNLCRQQVSAENYDIIDRASGIRNMFAHRSAAKNNEIPKWLQNALGENYFRRASSLAKELILK